MTANNKRTIYVGKFHNTNFILPLPVLTFRVTGGLADEVDERVLNNVFLPFGDILDVQIPLDYETEKHRGFAFIEFEAAEDAAAAIDNMVRTYTDTRLWISFPCALLNYCVNLRRMNPNYLDVRFGVISRNHKK